MKHFHSNSLADFFDILKLSKVVEVDYFYQDYYIRKKPQQLRSKFATDDFDMKTIKNFS